MVPSYKRKESKMEFISVARELVNCSKCYGEKIGKRHHWLGVRQVFESAINVLTSITLANSFNPKIDYEERAHYFKLALGHLDCVSVGISILKPFTKNDKKSLTDSQWEHWGILIMTERKLIKGVNGLLKYSKQRRLEHYVFA